MSTTLFDVQSHTIPCQHIREYRHATLHDDAVLHLCVKQYRPLNNPKPRPGDITIIAAHANGIPKELYEPFWDDLLEQASRNGFRIRGIWIADVAHQGASGVLNEDKLGDEPSWHDHTRDLLHMINHFRSAMPSPLIGIGHSMGGAQMYFPQCSPPSAHPITILTSRPTFPGQHRTNLSLIHPRLLTSLVLIEPVIDPATTFPAAPHPAQLSAVRRDLWPTRAAAADAFRKSAFYAAWDERVLRRWIEHGLRDLPTRLYPTTTSAAGGARAASDDDHDDAAGPPVTLTTTKAQEVYAFLRVKSASTSSLDRIVPTTGSAVEELPFYRPEAPLTHALLPYVVPPTLFVFGAASPLSTPPHRHSKLATTSTATAMGGRGGRTMERVKGMIVEDAGHFVVFERGKGEEVARGVAAWIGEWVGSGGERGERGDGGRIGVELSEEWLRRLKGWKVGGGGRTGEKL
ncbi:MAG: hypothetical protein M1833_007165 [Piccolia ochrophora]|nr:MAG: hypothetical protein M1833_007165 [Piccolia ochrophora]